jgi:hypothetical protein
MWLWRVFTTMLAIDIVLVLMAVGVFCYQAEQNSDAGFSLFSRRYFSGIAASGDYHTRLDRATYHFITPDGKYAQADAGAYFLSLGVSRAGPGRAGRGVFVPVGRRPQKRELMMNRSCRWPRRRALSSERFAQQAALSGGRHRKPHARTRACACALATGTCRGWRRPSTICWAASTNPTWSRPAL